MSSVPKQRGFGRAARTHFRSFEPPSPLPNFCHSFMFWIGFAGLAAPGAKRRDLGQSRRSMPQVERQLVLEADVQQLAVRRSVVAAPRC